MSYSTAEQLHRQTGGRSARLQRQRPSEYTLYTNSERIPLQENPRPKRHGHGLLGLIRRKRSARNSRVQPAAKSSDASLVTLAKKASLKSKVPSLRNLRSRDLLGPKEPESHQFEYRSKATWDPPPLFQAYPQAIKHGKLSTPSLSADQILLVNERKASLENTGTPLERNGSAKNEEATGSGKHGPSIPGSASRINWVQKIFVLVTSGYLLQYSIDGHHDRLPEKILQLTKQSVAFASDAIPGKHWVVQVSKTASDDGAVDLKPSKSLMYRLRLQSEEKKRTCKSFLLIMDNPDELESWLGVVRREIEALGSTKYRQQSPHKPSSDSKLEHRVSRTLLIKRDSDRFSTFSSSRTSLASDRSARYSMHERRTTLMDHQISYDHSNLAVNSLQRSSWSRSAADTVTLSSIETSAAHTKRRHSTLSTASGISRCSHCGSEPSLSLPSFSNAPDMPSLRIEDRTRNMSEIARFNPAAPDHRRKSFANLPPTYYRDIITPPETPNFSMPTFSKRYSTPHFAMSPLGTPPIPSEPWPIDSRPVTKPQSQSSSIIVRGVRRETQLFEEWTEYADETPSPLPPSQMSLESPARRSTFPKRLSSLEYSRIGLVAPSPPPTTALPNLPPMQNGLRRPMSMQLRPPQTVKQFTRPSRSSSYTEPLQAFSFHPQTTRRNVSPNQTRVNLIQSGPTLSARPALPPTPPELYEYTRPNRPAMRAQSQPMGVGH